MAQCQCQASSPHHNLFSLPRQLHKLSSLPPLAQQHHKLFRLPQQRVQLVMEEQAALHHNHNCHKLSRLPLAQQHHKLFRQRLQLMEEQAASRHLSPLPQPLAQQHQHLPQR